MRSRRRRKRWRSRRRRDEEVVRGVGGAGVNKRREDRARQEANE